MSREGYDPQPEPSIPVGENVHCSECERFIERDEMYALITTPRRGVLAPIKAVCSQCETYNRARGSRRSPAPQVWLLHFMRPGPAHADRAHELLMLTANPSKWIDDAGCRGFRVAKQVALFESQSELTTLPLDAYLWPVSVAQEFKLLVGEAE